jgi:hypothetical protein
MRAGAPFDSAHGDATTNENSPSVVRRPPSFSEVLTMKRMTLAITVLVALLFLGYAALFAWPGSQGRERNVEQAPLRPLPALSSADQVGGGMGHDGSDLYGDAPDEAPGLRWHNPLAEAVFHLTSALPGAPATLPVYERAGGPRYTQADAVRLAALFDFIQAYEQKYVVDDPAWTTPPVYHFFDGLRQFNVSDAHYYYLNHALAVEGDADLMPFAEAGPLAEAFLKERGLLDFPYEMAAAYGFHIEFRRVVDGRAVLFPEFQVAVHRSGEMWYVSHTPLSGLAAAGSYPLRPAEEAWQELLDAGIDYRRSTFAVYPGPNYVPPQPVTGAPDRHRHWERRYSEGDTITLYTYPTIFLPIGGGAAPRIQVEQYVIDAAIEELWAIAGQPGKQLFIQGRYREGRGGGALELLAWQSVEQADYYTLVEGSVRRDGETAVLISDEGETFVISSPPADLFDGDRIYMYGWLLGESEGAGRLFDWSGMAILVEAEEMDVYPDPMVEYQPHRITEVTVNEVALMYMIVPVYEEVNRAPRMVALPVWRFRGESDTNEIVEIYVQAVTDDYIQEPALEGPRG